MIILFTDFGVEGPYVGQMKAVLQTHAPSIPVIDLMHDAPAFDAKASAYLLAALILEFPKDTIFLGVIDPQVGNPSRRPIVIKADDRYFVGPDNGLFNVIAMRANHLVAQEITWRPKRLSTSFHGRDLFAPVAAKLAKGEIPLGNKLILRDYLRTGWPDDLNQVIYIDRFGNVITGVRAATLHSNNVIEIDNHIIQHANTFSDVPQGQGFWYKNSSGLLEIAVNRGRADQQFGIKLGDEFTLLSVIK